MLFGEQEIFARDSKQIVRNSGDLKKLLRKYKLKYVIII